MQKWALVIVLVVLVFGSTGKPGVLAAGGNPSAEVKEMFSGFMFRGMNRDKSRETRKLVEDNLQVGDSAARIEDFLAKHFGGGTYNRFANKYQAIIRDVAHDPKLKQVVVIYIFVDDTRSFVRAEVFDAF